ncbi:MAG: hypothetical protein OZSIB_2517 [Candidatus Ozemobacter sibiricus]|uniref:Putative zinc-finger domain-containing protein n=1 Tax=Candidatus Ozemobacter sibiricus TaxID=2268124 RepID=A0A367ZSW9_9BACT|nr:MAG: hypothetical protein OZSIB_2517 [Candidatus Ozemobacter sibiricus]
MDCRETAHLMDLARAGRLPPEREAALQAHLAHCERCRQHGSAGGGGLRPILEEATAAPSGEAPPASTAAADPPDSSPRPGRLAPPLHGAAHPPPEADPRDFASPIDTLGWLLVAALTVWVICGGTPAHQPSDRRPPAAPPLVAKDAGPSREGRVYPAGEAQVLVEGEAVVSPDEDALVILGGRGRAFLVTGRRAVLRIGSATRILRDQPFEFDLPLPAATAVSSAAAP